MLYLEKNKEIFREFYGLSCAENYFLYILFCNRYNYELLYYRSYLPMTDIFFSFTKGKEKYASYSKISRLPDVAVETGLAEFNLLEYSDISGIDIDCDVNYLIGVKPEFIEYRYKTKLWREDHYLLLCNKTGDGEYGYVNDTPRDQGTIKLVELNENYNGKVLSIRLIRGITSSDENVFLSSFKQRLSHQDNLKSFFCTSEYDNIRDALGVLRISRKRIKSYCSLYINTEFMDQYLQFLDQEYLALEYCRIKNRLDYDRINQDIAMMFEWDKEICNKLWERMNARYEKSS